MLVGGVVTLILWLNSDDEQQAGGGPATTVPSASATTAGQSGTSAPESAPESSSPSGTSDSPNTGAPGDAAPGGQPTNELLADSFIDAVNNHDGPAMVDMVCRSITGVDEPEFQDDTAAELIEARDDGETGSIEFTVTESGQTDDVTFNTRLEGGMWCLSGPG